MNFEIPHYSIVIPLKNESENITSLINEIVNALDPYKVPYEILCIDDGSTDNTLEVLAKLQEKTKPLRILSFDRNYGQSSAFDAGFKMAKAPFIITLDGDGQNNPADIPLLIDKKEEADLVCGIRQKRKDVWHKRMISRLANFVRSRFCKDGVEDTGCSLKLYRKEALAKIKLFHGMHRFLPALFVMEGYRIAEVKVSHRPRLHGKTNYNFMNRSLNTFFDMLAVRWMARRSLRWQIEKEL